MNSRDTLISGSHRLLVLGLGKTGSATCECALQQGWSVKVVDEQKNEKTENAAKTLSARGAEVSFTPFSSLTLSDTDLLVPSPGIAIPPALQKEAEKKNVPIFSEIELAFQLFPNPQIVAVTGTNGKTTTAQLIYFLLSRQGRKAYLCGNIGTPFIALAPIIEKEAIVVLEVSSFQLAFIHRFHPHLALFLNIDEDHLDRHKTVEDYFQEKARLFSQLHASDTAILYAGNPRIADLGASLPCPTLYFSLDDHQREGAFLRKEEIWLRLQKEEKSMGRVDELPIRTLPFLENLLAAITASAVLLKDAPLSLAHLSDFSLSPHRLQSVGEIGDVTFINDSKATNPHAVKGALLSVPPPVVLILGGRDKDLSFEPLLPLFRERVKAFILIGEARRKIDTLLKPLDKPIRHATCMKDAVKKAYKQASPIGTVLLSPGCASFDMYSSYEERGDDFAKEVKQLGQHS